MNINKIYHYYLPDRGPFLSLSDLPDEADNPIFKELLTRHKQVSSYNRRYGVEYLKTRKIVEEKLRTLFVERGGCPNKKHPIYFTLGESTWFKKLNAEHAELSIPISKLPEYAVSITFPDSYIAMTDQSKPYFEKVYFLSEIPEIISKYGLPTNEPPKTYEKYWEGSFEHYFEVQVWDSEILKQYSTSTHVLTKP